MTDDRAGERFRTLMRDALDRTAAGGLDWQDTPQEDAFVAIFPSGMLKVRRADRLAPDPADGPNLISEELFEVSLLTRTGEEVMEEAFAGFLARESVGGRLWHAARARARGAGDLLDAVLREVAGPTRTAPPDARAAA